VSVRISLSKTTMSVGETVALRADPAGGTVTGARWQFGDGRSAAGTTVEHAWTVAGTYQVSVVVTFADGRTATTAVAVTVRAVAVPQSTLTLQVQGAGTLTAGGAVCPPTCTVSVDRGTAVQVTARPAVDAHLTAWGGVCSGTAPTCTVTMDADKAAAATFAGTLAAPRLFFPDDNYQYHVTPRGGTLFWNAVTGAVSYRVELQQGTTAFQDVTTAERRYDFQWPADGTGRWRVTAIGADGALGKPSGWRTFRWSLTAVNGFAGAWENVDGASARPRAEITVTSSSTATLRVYQCLPGTSCSWSDWGVCQMDNGRLEHIQVDGEDAHIVITLSGGRITMDVTFSNNVGASFTEVMSR
jgi:PKD repeat protein